MKPPRTTDEVRLPGATLHCSCGADFSLPAVGGGRTSREGIEAVCPACHASRLYGASGYPTQF